MRILINAKSEREFKLFREISQEINPLMKDGDPTFGVKRMEEGESEIMIFESNKWIPLYECEISIFNKALTWLLLVDNMLSAEFGLLTNRYGIFGKKATPIAQCLN